MCPKTRPGRWSHPAPLRVWDVDSARAAQVLGFLRLSGFGGGSARQVLIVDFHTGTPLWLKDISARLCKNFSLGAKFFRAAAADFGAGGPKDLAGITVD